MTIDRTDMTKISRNENCHNIKKWNANQTNETAAQVKTNRERNKWRKKKEKKNIYTEKVREE